MSDKTETPFTYEDAIECLRTFAQMNGVYPIHPNTALTAKFAVERIESLERELTQWRKVAGRLKLLADRSWHGEGCLSQMNATGKCICGKKDALAAYDALAQQADGGKG